MVAIAMAETYAVCLMVIATQRTSCRRPAAYAPPVFMREKRENSRLRHAAKRVPFSWRHAAQPVEFWRRMDAAPLREIWTCHQPRAYAQRRLFSEECRSPPAAVLSQRIGAHTTNRMLKCVLRRWFPPARFATAVLPAAITRPFRC